MDSRVDLTIQDFLEGFPAATALLAKSGLGKFEDPQVVASLGSVLKLRSALAAASIDAAAFLESVDALGAQGETPEFGDDYANQSSLRMLGLMPCGMKMPFKKRFEAFLETLEGEPPRCLVEGNVNHELSYYPYVDTLTDADELPDVIVSSDINAFFHEKFVGHDAFETYEMPTDNRDFAATDYVDPRGIFTMLSANLLVVVVNRRRLGELSVPARWSELLEPAYENTVTMRGQDSFFCSGVLLPILQRFGEDGVASMARSVVRGMHPAQMVKEIEGGGPSGQGSPFYIMPLFFAHRLKDESRFEIVIPEEGAIISPVFMLVKKGKREQAQVLADFIAGRELGQFCADADFPSLRGDVDNHLPEGTKLWWMGWDFMTRVDPLKSKQRITEIFAERFQSLST